MRIVYANARYVHHSPEGGAAHIRQFIESSTALGHEIFLWHGIDPHPQSKPVPQGWLARYRLLRTADVIYYRLEHLPPDGARVILPPHRILAGNPLVAWEFNTVPEYGRLKGMTDEAIAQCTAELKRLAPGVDVAFCVSDKLAEYVRDTFKIPRIVIVPNGSDPELFKPGLPIPPRIEKRGGRLDVVWIGSANLGWHNFEMLRNAASSVWRSKDPIVFHILGPGMQAMREAPPNMNYYGAEQYNRLPDWLAAMDVGVNVYSPGPADYSSPLKIFDYMASGLAIVSAEQPQVRQILQQLGQEDLMVPADNPEALAAVLRKLAADPHRVRQVGAAGRELIISRYNWKRTCQDIFAALESLRR
jgi:glycosyltransferase involved in cell wall biosynthesis